MLKLFRTCWKIGKRSTAGLFSGLFSYPVLLVIQQHGSGVITLLQFNSVCYNAHYNTRHCLWREPLFWSILRTIFGRSLHCQHLLTLHSHIHRPAATKWPQTNRMALEIGCGRVQSLETFNQESRGPTASLSPSLIWCRYTLVNFIYNANSPSRMFYFFWNAICSTHW